MKKGVLLCLSVGISLSTIAQVTENLPFGFKRAHVPAALKNFSVKVPYRAGNIDNQAGPVNSGASVAIPHTGASSSLSSLYPVVTEEAVGITFYDLQTNNSVSNRIVVNGDGSISMAWTFSPNSLQTTTPPFPDRGTGYNYVDAAGVLQTPYPGNLSRTEASRTGFTNIVTTPSGKEMTIAHQAASGNFNRLALNWRPVAGQGAWTLSWPWGSSGYDTWAKAVGDPDNEDVYVIWHGSGAPVTTTSPPNIVRGQNGPIFFSKSADGGQTWTPKTIISLIDSSQYRGFGGDCYSIDAKGGTVAISYGDALTDVGLLKSTDGGTNWTKTIVQQHPVNMYAIDMLIANDSMPVETNSGDSKVIIDNEGICHVFFSTFLWYDDDSTDDSYNYFPSADNLYYWNESMGPDPSPSDTIQTYVVIAAAQDFNGNDSIDVLYRADTTCSQPFGNYGFGLTGQPSAGIDDLGNLYLTYMSIDETADTAFYHQAHRHIYMINKPKESSYWSYPIDVVLSVAQGGSGNQQEAAFGTIARKVVTDLTSKYAYVLYQRDNAPGHSLATAGTCDQLNNDNQSNDLVLAKVDMLSLGTKNLNNGDVFVTQNYPNPSHGSTYINVATKKKTDIFVELTDIVGKVLHSETKVNMPEGTHTIQLNTNNLKAGLYNYTVIAGGQKTTRQMIVQ